MRRGAELRALNMGELAGCPAAPSLKPPFTPPLPRRASKRKSARSWSRGRASSLSVACLGRSARIIALQLAMDSLEAG